MREMCFLPRLCLAVLSLDPDMVSCVNDNATIIEKTQDADSKSKTPVEVPIVYDAMTFTPTRRGYPTYKRELYVILDFARKYDYLCKHPYISAVVHTDHKPLTHFLGKDAHQKRQLGGSAQAIETRDGVLLQGQHHSATYFFHRSEPTCYGQRKESPLVARRCQPWHCTLPH